MQGLIIVLLLTVLNIETPLCTVCVHVSLSVTQKLSYKRHLCALLCFCPFTAGGQFRPEVSAPLCQRGISSDVQEADQAGEGQ